MEARHGIISLCNLTTSKHKDVGTSKCVYFPSCSWFKCVSGAPRVSRTSSRAEWFHAEMVRLDKVH